MAPRAAGYEVLARKWRPRRFEDVVGQEAITRNLKAALSSGRIAQAFLFTGPRGVGKTTVARILARALNCERGPAEEPCDACASCEAILSQTSMDVLEIDAASRTGVDDVRELREQTLYTPASSRYRVYIIDEVHMLSTQAFNALLKTLEEPPPHVKFVFATTDPQKIPATVLSRTQRYDFGRIRAERIAARLADILARENAEAAAGPAARPPLEADDDALLLIARKGEGSLRDSLSLLDQAFAAGMTRITVEGLESLLGLTPSERFHQVFRAIRAHDAGEALRVIDGVYRQGSDLREFSEGFTSFLRDLLILSTDPKLEDLIEASDRERQAAREAAAGVPPGDLLRYLQIAAAASEAMRRAFLPRVHLEAAVLEMAHLESVVSLGEALRKLGEGGGSRGPAPTERSKGSSPPPDSPRRGPRGEDFTASAAGFPGARSDAAFPGAAAATGFPGLRSDAASPGAAAAPSSAAGPAPAAATAPVHAAVSAVATPAPAAASVAEDGSDARPQHWAAVVERLVRKKASLGSALAGSHFLGIDEGGRLRIVVEMAFHRDLMDHVENKRLIEHETAEVFGRRVGIRCLTRAEAGLDPPSSASSPGCSGDDAGRARVDAKAPVNRPGVQRIMDIFGRVEAVDS